MVKESRRALRAGQISVGEVGPQHLVHLQKKGYMADADIIYSKCK
jgi:hypothetical protein